MPRRSSFDAKAGFGIAVTGLGEISRSDTSSIRLATSPSTFTASGIATRTARPSANVADRSLVTTVPACQHSAVTGATFAATPMRSVWGPARRPASDATEESTVAQAGRRRPQGGSPSWSGLALRLPVAFVFERLGAVLEEQETGAGRVLRAASLAWSRSRPPGGLAPSPSTSASSACVAPSGA